MSPWLHQLLVDHHSIACSRYGCSLRIPQQYWHVAGAAGTRAAHHVCSLKRRQQLAEWGGGASADEQGRFDEVVEDGGVRILIEPAALMHVIGTTMDFVEDRIKCPTSPPLLPMRGSCQPSCVIPPYRVALPAICCPFTDRCLKCTRRRRLCVLEQP